MNEIATYSMILQKIQLGQTSNYCPTKTEILAIDQSVIINNVTDYLANECVKLVDIDKQQQNTYTFKFVKNNVDTINTTVNSSSITLLENIVTTLNDSWNHFVVHSKSDWITFANGQPGDPILASFVRIQVSSNPNIGARTGQIVFRQIGSGKLLTWNIVQDGLGENYVFTWEDGTTINKSFPTDHESINSVHFGIISTLNSNYHPFIINNAASWITITQNNGDVYLNIQANDTYFDRTTTIQFAQENSNNILRLTVTQSAMPSPIEESFYFQGYEPTVHERNIGWDHEQHTITIGIVSTYDNTFTPFTVAHFDGSSFLNYSTVSVLGGEPTNVKIDCPQNTTNTSRTEKLILMQSNTGRTLYIEVIQTGADNTYVFTTDMSNVTLNATPGYVVGNVTSTKNGIAHIYQLTSGQVNWVDTTSNLENGILTITATQENLGSARTTTLVFTQQDSGKTISIPVTQLGADIVLITNPESLITLTGMQSETVQVISTINGNIVPYTITTENAGWLNVQESSNSFTVQPISINTTGSNRTATITITQNISNYSVQLYVTQPHTSTTERYVWNHIGLDQNSSYVPVQDQNNSRITFRASEPNQYIQYEWQIQSYKEVLINNVVDHIEPIMPQFTGVNDDLCEVSVTTSSVNDYTFDIQINVSENRTVYNWQSTLDPLRIHQIVGGDNYNTISTTKQRVNVRSIVGTESERFLASRYKWIEYLGCSQNPKYVVHMQTVSPLSMVLSYIPLSKFEHGTQVYINSSLEKAGSYVDIQLEDPSQLNEPISGISSYVNVESVYSGASDIFTVQILNDRIRITRVSDTQYIPTNDGLAFKINVNILGYTDLVLEIYAISDWNLIG